MSSAPQMSNPLSNFESILDAALSEYKLKTGKELLDHTLATEVQGCDTVDAVLAILQDQAKAFQQFKDGDQKLIERIGPLTQVLFAFSETLGVGDIGLAFPPAKGITAGIAVLLSAAKDVRASYDALVELFEHIEIFFKPLGSYTRISSTAETVEVFVKITAEVLSILSIATREVTRWRAKIYFRNLLGRADIEDVLKKLDSLIQELIQMAKAQVMKAASELKSNIKKVCFSIPSDVMWKTGLDVRKWFSPPDPSTSHNTACGAYHNVPSMWFFGGDLFKDWMSNGFVLWIHGKSGSGKTILCSSIIQHVMNLRNAGQATLAYYYFDFRNKEKQDVRNFITSVLCQLSEFSKPHFDIIYRLYLSHGNGMRQPSNHVLMACLKEMLMAAPEQPAFLIIDSLDECSDALGFPNSREAILDVVKELTHHPRHRNLRFCITSRPEVDLQTGLEPLAVSVISLHGQSERKGDIADHLCSVVSFDENLKTLRDEDKKLVVQELSERADGMFQWVFCQLETLRRSVKSDVRGVLEKLPKTLDETYERMLEDITETDREHARRLFHCLAVAVRPLCVEELAEILSFDFEEAQGGIPTFGRSENQIEAILSACSSLIAIVNDGDSRVVQFSNLSVKEFLTSDHLASSSGDLSRFQILPKAAHTIFAQVCLGSLLHLEDRVDKEGFKGLSLTQYAAQHWVTHAQFEGVASSVADGMQSLFDPDKPYFSAWVRTYDMDRHSDGTSQNEMPNPLYYAALCGFYDLVKHFAIKYPQHVDAIGGFYQFPLVAALCNKHLQVAGVLLEHGGTVDVRESGGETVLHKIIQLNGQNIDTVQFLLECGADVNARREDLSTPLHLAIVAGELNVARLLLEHNADVDPQNDKGLAPLHLLTRQELSTLEDIDSDFAVLLLESGANVNLQAKDNSTPLHLASYNQKFEIVQVLLDKGANADAENSEGRTPLQEVLRDDRPSIEDGADVAGILLERGADAYARDKYHVTSSDLAVCFGKDKTLPSLFGNNAAFSLANDRDKTAFHKWLKECAADGNVRDKYNAILLHSSSYHGKLEMLQVLLDNDVNVNVKNHLAETALHAVSRGKDNSQEGVHVAQLLLERGGDVNAENDDHRTPLHAASYYGRLDIAQLLLDHGANANAEDMFLRKPLHQVSFGEYESQESGVRVAQLLLEHGLDVNASDKYLWTPLHLASYKPRPKIVEVLLDHSAKVDPKNDQGETPLHLVSRTKYDPQDVHVAQLLLDHGADANAKRNDYCTPLHGVAFSARFDIVRVLLDHGATMNAGDRFLRTPLHTVSLGQYDSQEDGVRTAQLLLERGVDMNARDKNRETPLHLASSSGKPEIVWVLLEHATAKNDQDPSHLGIEERGVDVNAHRSDHWTPLHLASFLGSPDIVQVLLDHGARVDAVDNLFRTSLHHVSGGRYKSQEDGLRIAQLLLESGATVNAKDINRETPLHFVAFFGRLEIARMFLKHAAVNDGDQDSSSLGQEGRGVAVNARRKDNWTPLHLASHCAKLEMARLLLDHGANANAEDNLLRTPLHHVTGGQHAVEEDAIRVSQLLIERGADLNAQDIRCETPLHSASSSGRLGLVRVLLAHVAVRNDQDQGPSQLGSEERGVEVDARKTDDWTPLHLAAYFGRPEVTRALLDYGASANAVNDVGETPLYVASRGVYQSQDDGVYIARLLLERGGNVNTQTKDHWTALHAASYFGKPEIVRTLLDQGANANVKNRQGKNSLDLVSRGEYGSEEDGVRVTQFLLERGVDVNASDRDHWTPLHSASYYGRPEIVRTLLDHGAEVNAENDEREPPLNMVSRGKYPSQADGVRIAQLLLDRGADVNARLKGDWTPLNWASYYGRPDLARVLVDHGALVNKKNNFLRTPLHDVSRGEYESQEDGARIARILSERGADIKVEDKNGDTPLHFASSFGRVEIARVLFDHGAIANVANYDGETPLHVISRGKSDSQDAIRLLQLLIERGVDVNALDKDRETPLHTACCFGKLDIARELLDRGATATAKNGRGETPLHVLSRGEYKSQDGFHIARLLLEHGADANAPDMDGDTPLHSACGNGKLDIARQLLTHGAAADVKSIQGETPLHVVSTDGARVARLLLEHGVDVNIHDKNHRTPLGAASFHGNLEIARVLLDHGATADAKDDYGWTALHLVSQYQGATEERGLGVARLLLERGADAQVPDINHVTPLDLASRRGWSKMVQVLLEDETKVKLA